MVSSGFALTAGRIGRIISLEGEVKLLRNQENIRIKSADFVSAGDVLTTGKRSSARFLLNDDSIVDIKENSRFIFVKLSGTDPSREVELALDFGKVRASINKKVIGKNNYRLKTKATVFAVRGTDFAVTSDESDNSKLNVFEGNVAAKTSAAEDLVAAEHELAVSAGKFSKTKLSAQQIELIFEASRTEDVNFYQNMVIGDYRISRNSGVGTINFLNKLVVTPTVQIPKDAFKVLGVSQLNASAISSGILNMVITNVGVKIQ